MFTYLGWLLFNLKIRVSGWWKKPECTCEPNCNCENEVSSSSLETIIEETDPKYDYNKFV